jgi:hypothetical protein
MGTRSGDLDPSVLTYLMKKEDLTPEQMEEILNKKSGVYGVSRVSMDFRDIEYETLAGGTHAKLSLDIFCNLIAGYIMKCAVAMGGNVITDSIASSSRQYMKFAGDMTMTVKKTNASGAVVSTETVSPDSVTDYTWTYNIPADDTTPYVYTIEYETTVDTIYAGGDTVTGPMTVIKAMEAGRKSAKLIDEKLK